MRGDVPAELGVNFGLLCAAAALNLKRVAVGALRDRGVLLVGDDLDAVERAEVLVGAVVLALVDGAFDAHVCSVVFHGFYLPYKKNRRGCNLVC